MKKNGADRRNELRGLMQREVEKNLISDAELGMLAGSLADTVAKTSELTCKCWCATGLLSTCAAGSIGEADTVVGQA